MGQLLRDESIPHVSDRLREYVMAAHYGWTPNEIRSLGVSDFYSFSTMAMVGLRLKNADVARLFSAMFGATH